MTLRAALMNLLHQDGVNFFLTNRLPRRRLTTWMGWFSRIENPLVCAASLRVWRFFTDLDLSDARETRFRSMHQCFTRRLQDGARPVNTDPAILVSPCDAIVGAAGTVVDGCVLQVKGRPYALADLLGDAEHARSLNDGQYVTLRLTSAMYHRFHAPHDCHVWSVAHLFGDTWNVNPVTLQRVDRLFCKNERAVIRMTLSGTGHALTLVPVAAILVAGIRLGFLDLDPTHRKDALHRYACDASLRKGDEMGWFEHGSTIIVFAPAGFRLCEGVRLGSMIRVGQALMHLPTPAS
jgi:phosphatidylserine decarboxylase